MSQIPPLSAADAQDEPLHFWGSKTTRELQGNGHLVVEHLESGSQLAVMFEARCCWRFLTRLRATCKVLGTLSLRATVAL